MKLALSEDVPTIKPYDQARWAELADSNGPLDSSLDLLDALHRHWADLLHRLSEEDCRREFRHPESGLMTIAVAIALYEWHGRHHTAHLHHAVRSR